MALLLIFGENGSCTPGNVHSFRHFRVQGAGVPGDTARNGDRPPGNSRGDVVGVIAGHTNIVLVHSRSVRVRWLLVHPTRPDVGLLGEDSSAYAWQADHLFFHKGLGEILHRQRAGARSYGDIHAGWSCGFRGEEGLKGGGPYR